MNQGTCVAALSVCLLAAPARSQASGKSEALVVGETFTIDSKALGETRRINVYLPPPYFEAGDVRLPVLYMPDGGMAEDFLHIAGLVQISVANQTMRPFLLVGIENTQRRRDLTGPTANAEDKKIAPQVGGSAAFRELIRKELMPEVGTRYRTTGETAIVGESLAGLFVVETFLLEPDLFSTYIAIDPSLWWNDQALVNSSAERLKGRPGSARTLYLATSDEKGLIEIGSQGRFDERDALSGAEDDVDQDLHERSHAMFPPGTGRGDFPPSIPYKTENRWVIAQLFSRRGRGDFSPPAGRPFGTCRSFGDPTRG